MTRRNSAARFRCRRARRRGLASLETVMTTAFTLPFMIFALVFAVEGTRFVWKITVQMLGWPLM